MDGVEPAPVGPGGEFVLGQEEAGVPFWNVELDLPPGRERTVSLELEEPVVPGAPRVVEQPLARPLEATVTGPACR